MDTVQVVLRIRPMLQCELAKDSVLEIIQGVPQVKLLSNKFTFNHVFDDKVPQNEVYDNSVKNLVQELFKGYNVTVIAYGQTGSGKTYTMGTTYTESPDKGIIPRAIQDIFDKVLTEKEWEYKIKTSFVELYNEQLYDLLSGKPRDQSIVDMREDSRGVFIPGLTEVDVTTSEATLQCLQQGSFGRTTGATAVNTHSSRSHAIFTIYITQTKKGSDTEALSAKFHLVDLAGSERSKKTRTTGDRFKEGVHINRGLFVLGNVISALGEGNKTFINYRDSKLTRLLQDSLGGNALTIMIACLSADYDNRNESLNTLRYADRARRIKNRPIVNRDPKAAEIAQLKKENEELKLKFLSHSITEGVSPCPLEHGMLTQKVKNLCDALSVALKQISAMSERALMSEKARDHMNGKLVELDRVYNHIVDSVQTTLNESQLINLKNLKTHIVDLQTAQQLNEEEITMHERLEELLRPSEGSPRLDGKGAMAESPGEDLKQQDNYLMQQVELSNKLQELTTHLARKKLLVMSKSCQMYGMQTTSKKDLVDLEQQIEDLLKEKEELICQLNVQIDTASVELTEQRQNRLQELELDIAALNKKLTEQERLIKVIEDSDLKIDTLRSEIVSMKQTKADFVGQMKIVIKKYKAYKIEQEKEISKPKQQDHKRQDQIKKSENIHTEQQNVLKHKVKEVNAVKKRLKDALALKKNVQEGRTLQSHPESVTQLINQELEVVLSILEAERTFDQLNEGQVTLKKNLQDLKHKVNTSLLKNDERIKLEEEMNHLNQNLGLTSALIMDLGQVIEESNQENTAETRWKTIRSMIDAKCALTYLFDALVDTKKETETVNKGVMFQEIHNGHNELLNKLKTKEQEVVNLQKAMKKLEQESEEKILLLLRQLVEEKKGNNTASSDNDVLQILDDELSKLEDLKSSHEWWMNNCKKLQKVIDLRKVLTSTENKPAVNKIQKRKEIETVTSDEKDDSSLSLTTGDSPSNNEEIPFYKRLQRLKEQCRIYHGIKKASFQLNWLQVPQFSKWLEKVPNDTYSARCKLCLKTFNLSNMGRRAVSSHMNSAKHLKHTHAINTQVQRRLLKVTETVTSEERDDLSLPLTTGYSPPNNDEIDPEFKNSALYKRLQRLKQQPRVPIARRLPKVIVTVPSEDLSLPLTTGYSPPNNDEIDPEFKNSALYKRLQRLKQEPRVPIARRLPKVIETVTSEERDDLSLPLTTGYSPPNNDEIDPEFKNSALYKRLQRLKQEPRVPIARRLPKVVETVTSEERDDLSVPLTTANSLSNNEEIDPDLENNSLRKRLQRPKQHRIVEPDPTNDPDLSDENNLPLKKLKLNTDSSFELRDEIRTADTTANLSSPSDPSSSQGPNLMDTKRKLSFSS